MSWSKKSLWLMTPNSAEFVSVSTYCSPVFFSVTFFGAGGIQGGYTKYNAENSVIIGHMGDAGCVSWGEGKHFATYNGTITKPKDEVFSAKFGYYLLLHMICENIAVEAGFHF